jgi:hypothetical protein
MPDGRHHVGIPGAIKSEWVGVFVGIRTGEVTENTKGLETPEKIKSYALGGGKLNAIVASFAALLGWITPNPFFSYGLFGFCLAQASGVANLIPFKWGDLWSDGVALRTPMPFLEHVRMRRRARQLEEAASAARQPIDASTATQTSEQRGD